MIGACQSASGRRCFVIVQRGGGLSADCCRVLPYRQPCCVLKRGSVKAPGAYPAAGPGGWHRGRTAPHPGAPAPTIRLSKNRRGGSRSCAIHGTACPQVRRLCHSARLARLALAGACSPPHAASYRRLAPVLPTLAFHYAGAGPLPFVTLRAESTGPIVPVAGGRAGTERHAPHRHPEPPGRRIPQANARHFAGTGRHAYTWEILHSQAPSG